MDQNTVQIAQKRPTAALFNVRVSSSQKFCLLTPQILEDYIEREDFLNQNIFANLLLEKGLPVRTLLSMMNCGFYTGKAFIEYCGCTEIKHYLRHKCSSRVCPICSVRRKRRLTERYELALRHLCRATATHSLKLFTISPRNYNTLEEGFEHVRRSISKLVRRKYFKKRIKGGIYVIEAKSKEGKGWNVHAHMIVHSRILNNKLWGYCDHCKRKMWIRQDKQTKRFYCTNRSCNRHVEWDQKDSFVTREVKKAFSRDCTVDVQKVKSNVGSLHYILQYVSSNKNEFATEDDFATYIVYTKDKKLVHTFGHLYSKMKYYKKKKEPCYCDICKQEVKNKICEGDFHYPDEVKPPLVSA